MNAVTRTRQIETDVLNVLSAAECSGPELRLIGTLDRKLYMRTNEVLETLGGKWTKKAKAHVFDGDAADAVEGAVLTGAYSKTKQDFGAFFTPPELAERVIKLACIRSGDIVLEPSAGQGALALPAARVGADVMCVELLEKNGSALTAAGISSVVVADFLAHDFPTEVFDVALMNPPFAKRADIHHIRRAHSLLRPGGRLVSIASASVKFRNDKLAEDFRAFVAAHDGLIEDLPEGSFKASGTMVNTVLVSMRAEA